MKENIKIISKTIDYIESHLDEDIKLEDVAKAVGYSKFHLNRMFAENTGETIHKYMQKRRLSEAARELVFTDKAIVDIAQDASYDSQQAFTLAFRQLYFCTPQVYRKLGVFNSKQNEISMCFKSCCRRNANIKNVREFVISEGIAA